MPRGIQVKRRVVGLVGWLVGLTLFIAVFSAGVSFSYQVEDRPLSPAVFRELGVTLQRLDDHGRRIDYVEKVDLEHSKRIDALERSVERTDKMLDGISDAFKKLLIGIVSGVALMFIRMYLTSNQLKNHQVKVNEDVNVMLSDFLRQLERHQAQANIEVGKLDKTMTGGSGIT